MQTDSSVSVCLMWAAFKILLKKDHPVVPSHWMRCSLGSFHARGYLVGGGVPPGVL